MVCVMRMHAAVVSAEAIQIQCRVLLRTQREGKIEQVFATAFQHIAERHQCTQRDHGSEQNGNPAVT